MNTTGSASSGGVRLPDAEHGVSGWQTATGTRLRRAVASSSETNGSEISGLSSSTFIGNPRASTGPFNPNAYGNPKSPTSVANSMDTSNWSNTRAFSSANPATSSSKFPRIKAYVSNHVLP